VIEQILGAGTEFEGRKISLLGQQRVVGLEDVWERKAWLATQLAYVDEADLLIFVSDLDGGTGSGRRRAEKDIRERSGAISRGAQVAGYGNLDCVSGIACRTIEAWAMGDLDAVERVATDKGLSLPSGKGPEDLWGKPRDPRSNHPKMVLARLLGETASQKQLALIAELADVAAIRQTCPSSFEPFVAALEASGADD
jgi:hypothetical protein